MVEITTTPSQVRHPIRTLFRGLVQWGPPLALALPLIVQAVEDGHAGATGPIGAAVVLFASAVTRVMAVPFVNELLKRVNLDAGAATIGKHAAGDE